MTYMVIIMINGDSLNTPVNLMSNENSYNLSIFKGDFNDCNGDLDGSNGNYYYYW